MLRHKETTIISEIKNFFTSSEKAVNTIFTLLDSLTLSEKRLKIQSKSNNEISNINKLFLLLLFPFFDIKDAWNYRNSTLFQMYSFGKDLFYRFMNDSLIDWRHLSYKINMLLINQASKKSTDNSAPRCLILDDTDFQKTGRRIKLIGKITTAYFNRKVYQNFNPKVYHFS